MAFRVRKTFFDRGILQRSEDGQWVDVRPTDELLEGFGIVSLDFASASVPAVPIGRVLVPMTYLRELQERVAIAERRAATQRRVRARKRLLPVLTDVIPSPLKLAAERHAIERAIHADDPSVIEHFSNTQPGVHP